MTSQCPEFSDFSNILFDVKEKLSDEEYMQLYDLLAKMKALKCPEVESEPDFAGETTITMTCAFYESETEATEAWKVYSKGLEATILCLVGTTMLVAYNTGDETMFALGLLGLIVVIPQLKS